MWSPTDRVTRGQAFVSCVASPNSSPSSMKHPLPKRRRVSSNPLAPLSSSGPFNASPKPSRLTTCTSCHRTIGLKSSPTFLCARFVVFYLEALVNDSYHVGGNTAGVAPRHVLFACGRAQAILQLPSTRLVLSICHSIRSPFRSLKATRTSRLYVEDGPVTTITITC